MQKYRGKKIRVCGKNSIPLNTYLYSYSTQKQKNGPWFVTFKKAKVICHRSSD